jgi:hypothetical protein
MDKPRPRRGIRYVPPDRLQEKIGSIGAPIPGGTLEIDGSTGELIYRGPNVMMGCASSRQDLAKHDERAGELRTGDLARIDDAGFFYLTGRLKRFVKLPGNRVNLDEVERELAEAFGIPVACVSEDGQLDPPRRRVPRSSNRAPGLSTNLRENGDRHLGITFRLELYPRAGTALVGVVKLGLVQYGAENPLLRI